MKKRKIFARLGSAAAALFIAVSFLAPTVKAKDNNYTFEFSLNAGINNQLLVGYGAPFYVTVTNTGTSVFEGKIQLIIPNEGNQNVMYVKDISLGVGEKKTVLFNAGLCVNCPFVNVRMADNKDNVVFEEKQAVSVLKDKKTVRVGVITDDFSAVSYMDRQHFLADEEFLTGVTEITKDTLCDKGRSLDMYDVIVISDYSTDLLTDEQIDALASWTADGGLLMIGTGSTAQKTTSGFKNTFIDISLGDMETKTTTLGVGGEDYLYIDDIHNITNNYSYSYSTYNNSSSVELDDFYGYKYYDWDWPQGYELETAGVHQDENGNLVDRFGNYINPSYWYLFDESAGYTDPLSNEFHYKYYDDLYGTVDMQDPDFQIFYDDMKNWDEVDEYCMQEYFILLNVDLNRYLYDKGFTDSQERREVFDLYFGEDYEDFCNHHIYGRYYYYYNGVDVRTDIWGTANFAEDCDSMAVDVREVSVNGENANDIIGDTLSGDYTLGQVQKIGDGYLAVFGVDFTKNPIPKASYAGTFFRNNVEKIIGADIINEDYDYSKVYGYNNGRYLNYGEEELLRTMGSAPIPPMLLYMIYIAGFLLFDLIIYIILAKKKKTRKLWVVYPVASCVMLLLVFCTSFSTRLLTMNINSVAVINPVGAVTKETQYIAVVAPKKKQYTIDFKKNLTIDTMLGNGMYYYSDEIDYDQYAIVYYEGREGMESIVNNDVPLSSTEFKALTTYLTRGGAELSLEASPSIITPNEDTIKFTNNYATDLEDVMIIHNDANDASVYYYDSVKAGESVLLNQGREYDGDNLGTPYYYNDYNLTDYYSKYNVLTEISTLLIGELIPSNRDFVKRKAIYSALMSGTDLEENTVYAVGFPKGKIGEDVTENKFIKERKYEVVVLYENLDNLNVN